MRLSKSLIRAHTQCPLKRRWLSGMSKEDREAEGDTDGNRYGRAQHGALEDLFGWAKQTGHEGVLYAGKALEIVETAIDRRCADEGVTDHDAQERMHDAILDYLLDLGEFAGDRVIGVEHFLQYKSPQGHTIVGIADRIDRLPGGIVEIIDYKGGGPDPDGPVPSPDDVRNELDCRLYVAAAVKQFAWANAFRFTFAWLGSRMSASATIRADESKFLALSVGMELDQIAVGIENGPWLPETGGHCQRCIFKPQCPAWGGEPPDGWYDPRLAPADQSPTQ